MERLTAKINDSAYYVKGKYGPATLCAEMETWEVRECMKKLAAYEDTGLQPEELQEFMKRIDLKDLHDHISELLELEEQGLLIKLPCKVGDSVYFIMKEFDIAKESWKRNIDEYIVTEIRGNKYNPLWFMASSEKYTHIDFHPTQIGKTVFLTRQEAEKALEEK